MPRTGPRPMGKQARFYLDSGAEAFANQEQIKRQHEDGSPYRRDLRRAVIDEAAQDIGPPGEVDEGDHRKRQGGAEHHLAQHERLGRIDTDRDNDKGRRHSGQAPQPHRDAEANKALHDDLPGHRPDNRTRHARGEQREQEGAGGGAEQRRPRSNCPLMMRNRSSGTAGSSSANGSRTSHLRASKSPSKTNPKSPTPVDHWNGRPNRSKRLARIAAEEEKEKRRLARVAAVLGKKL